MLFIVWITKNIPICLICIKNWAFAGSILSKKWKEMWEEMTAGKTNRVKSFQFLFFIQTNLISGSDDR